MLIAIIIGVLTTILSMAFNMTLVKSVAILNNLNDLFFESLTLPILGGMILAVLNYSVLKGDSAFEIIISTNAEDKYAINLMTSIKKVFASIVSLVFGFSVGQQGTIVYIGEITGFFIADRKELNKDDLKTYMLCGIAGMIAGVFQVPFFALIFTYEVFSNHFEIKRMVYIATTITITYAIMFYFNFNRIFINVFLDVESFTLPSLLNLVIFSLYIGLIALVYVYTMLYVKRNIEFSGKRLFVFPIIIGILLFITGIYYPEIYNLHFNSFQLLDLGSYSIVTLAVILISKILLTDLSYNLGGYGGVFTPGLYIGGTAGLLFFKIFGIVESQELFIVYGIVGMLAGFANAPMASLVLALELTHAFELIPFLVVIVFTSSVIVRSILKESLYKKNKVV